MSPASLPSASNFSSELQNIEDAIRNWTAHADGPNKLAYRLDYQYTPASIAFNTLKGRDKEIYDRLRILKDTFGDPLLSIKMVVIENKEQGEAACGYGGGYDGMEEVFETDFTTKEWIHEDDITDSDDFSEVDISTELLVADDSDPNEMAFDEDHDESEFEGYTGNEGAPLTYWYRSVMIVCRPLCFDWTLDAVLEELEGAAVVSKEGTEPSATTATPAIATAATAGSNQDVGTRFEHHWNKLVHYINFFTQFTRWQYSTSSYINMSLCC